MRSWLLACTSMDVISEGVKGHGCILDYSFMEGRGQLLNQWRFVGTSIQLQQTKMVMAVTARFPRLGFVSLVTSSCTLFKIYKAPFDTVYCIEN